MTKRQAVLLDRLMVFCDRCASPDLPIGVTKVIGYGSFFRGKDRPGDVDLLVVTGEVHPLFSTVDDWKVWRYEGDILENDLVFVCQRGHGNILYSCKIRLRNDQPWEEQIHRLRIEFRRDDVLVYSEEHAFGDEEVTLPSKKWISLDLNHGLHDESIFARSDSVSFTAKTIGDNAELSLLLTTLSHR